MAKYEFKRTRSEYLTVEAENRDEARELACSAPDWEWDDDAYEVPEIDGGRLITSSA